MKNVKNLRSIGTILLLLLCTVMARPARAENIPTTIIVGEFGTISNPGLNCSNTQNFAGADGFSFNVGTGSCPNIGLNPSVSGNLSPYSGFVSVAGCDAVINGNSSGSPNCHGSVSVDGDYYFAGSGIHTFAFGSFFTMGAIGPNADLSLAISGPGGSGGFLHEISGTISPSVTLQLGEIYHVTYSGTFNSGGGQNGEFSYDFTTPGVAILEITTPEPGSGWMVLGTIPVFMLFRRAGLRLKNGRM
jgi:hypothetical protein